MTLVLIIPGRDTSSLEHNFREAAPDVEVVSWPAQPTRSGPCFALVWQPPEGALAGYPDLCGISSFGAGVDNILAYPNLPDVPLCRIVDADLAEQMARFVAHEVLHQQLRMPMFRRQQQDAHWKPRSAKRGMRVGLLGLGELGKKAAQVLTQLGFEVAGWSRSVKQLKDVDTYVGRKGLYQLVSGCDYLINLLPLTPETQGILNSDLFSATKPGCYLINAARGAHMKDSDLLDALTQGQLSGASVDVFSTEPLPADHPFWSHPNIRITPHCAAVTNQHTVIEQVLENYRRAIAGEQLNHQVDTNRHY